MATPSRSVKRSMRRLLPSLRAANMFVGTILTKKLIGALKQAGFEKVLDTSTGADIVTVEEGTELLDRLEENERLPLLTSCCSASILFVEKNFPQYLHHFCTVKSPQQSIGALVKTHYARRMKLKREKIFSVSIMPCVIKKTEAKRPEMEFNGIPHVDVVLTTMELVELLKLRKIDLKNSKEMKFDEILGIGSGAGQIFGTTGGVTEAMMRFVSWKLDGKNAKIDFPEIRGEAGFRDVEVKIKNRTLRIAIVDGLNNVKDLFGNFEKFSSYHVIELMSCPGGCIGGAGQPSSTPEKIEARRNALFRIDNGEKARTAMDNPYVQNIYKNYLSEPGSVASRSILHLTRICLNCEKPVKQQEK